MRYFIKNIFNDASAVTVIRSPSMSAIGETGPSHCQRTPFTVALPLHLATSPQSPEPGSAGGPAAFPAGAMCAREPGVGERSPLFLCV